jgi:hypothetical protein
MSVGEFQLGEYKFRLGETIFTLHKDGAPSFTLRIGVFPFGNNVQALNIQVHSPDHATIETDKQLMRLIYYNDNNSPNGQIEVSIKSDDPDGIPSWSTLMNDLPAQVIRLGISILNGDDDVEAYRVLRNNEGHIIRNANDPALANQNVPVPVANTNGNNPSGNNTEGGRRRQKRSTRSLRRRRFH